MKVPRNWIKEWQDLSVEDDSGTIEFHLSRSVKRWILYWIGIFIFCMVMIPLIATKLIERRLLNAVAAYIASATTDEYDQIAWGIRYDLVYRKFGRDIEKFVRYIPNTAKDCPTCHGDYQSQAFLVSANMGQLYALDVFVEGFTPDIHYGASHMSYGYDAVSQTALSMIGLPDERIKTVELRRCGGIVSIHKMKRIFCDNCINEMLNAVEDMSVGEFIIFDANKKVFYPIGEGITIQIGDYSLESERKIEDYEIIVRYTGE